MQFRRLSIGLASVVSLLLGIGDALVAQKGVIAAPPAPVEQVQTDELEQTVVTMPPIEQLPQLIEDLLRQGKYNQAVEILEHLLTYCKKMENLGCQAATLNDLGKIYATKGEFSKALAYYQEALPIVQKLKSPLLSLLLQNMGLTYFKLNDYQRSLKYYRDALQNSDNILDQTFSRLGIARQYEALGNYNEASIQYQKVLEMAQESNQKILISISLANIASLYVSTRKYDQAIEVYKKSLQMMDFSDSPIGYGNILNNLGVAYSQKGDYVQALVLLQEALKISKDYEDFNNLPFRQLNIADVYVGKGDFNSAIRNLESALDLSESTEREEVSMLIYEKFGDIYRKLEKYDTSLDYFRRQLSQSSTPNNRVLALNQIAYGYELKNLPKLAISIYKQSVNILENLRENLKFLSRNEQSLYTQKIANTYRDLADLLTQQGRLAEAQQVIELLKIRELKELEVNKTKSGAAIQQLPISESEKQAIAQIVPEVAKEIIPTALPQPDRLSPTNPLNRSAQALLTAQPNAALIYQLFTQDKLWLILITPDGKLQRFASTANQAQIESITARFRQQIEQCEKLNAVCDKNDTKTLNQTSQQLYQQLFPAALQTTLKAANPQHLILALDGSLRNIPIAALHTGQQYLAEQYTLSSIIAAQLTDSQDKLPANPLQSPVLAVGTSQQATIPVPDYVDADRQDVYRGLSNVPIELNAIVSTSKSPSAFPGNQLLDEQFTLPNLRQQLPKHRLFHIGSHGIFRPNFLDYSYILMGNNQPWSIAQMDTEGNGKLFQNIHMVTLSACQSGLGGRDKTGMEIAGMSHAFLSQGAKTVTASLWQVDDASTAMLMQRFYQNLAKFPNQSKAESLHQAQLYLLQTPRQILLENLGRSVSFRPIDSPASPTKPLPSPKTADYTHPYYWASFTLIGNSR
jgi:CHAT domain-containing protein